MPKKHQSKLSHAKARKQLQKIYQTTTESPVEVSSTAALATPVAATNSQDLMMARLVKKDLIKTLLVALMLIILLSAIYAVRNTAGVETVINKLAGYVGF